jgi:hypothetical protein
MKCEPGGAEAPRFACDHEGEKLTMRLSYVEQALAYEAMWLLINTVEAAYKTAIEQKDAGMIAYLKEKRSQITLLRVKLSPEM